VLMMIISRIHFPTTKNTIAFSIVTVIYIIAYLPTVCVETLNASGVYKHMLCHALLYFIIIYTLVILYIDVYVHVNLW
jgi:hypothetical protein